METRELVYITCVCLGLGSAFLGGLMAGVFPRGAGAPAGLPLLSPTTLSMSAAGFGVGGLFSRETLGWPLAGQLAGAICAAVGVALGTAWLLGRCSRPTAADGPPEGAEVTVALPPGGLGEIAFTERGSRRTGPARSADGQELPARTPVKIVRRDGTTYLVERLP